jgi:5-(carboxyamino)imidazole ribonucleotide synthase
VALLASNDIVGGSTMRIGIFGGGQLAQMLTQAAISLGVEIVICERLPDSPAARYTQYAVVGPWEDETVLTAFARQCDLVTLENEFIDAGILERIETHGVPVWPRPATVAVVQDKLRQKERLASAGLTVPPFRAVTTPDDVLTAAQEFGWPLVLKTRRNGYDGYGNATIRTAEEVIPAWERLTRGGSPLLVEAWVPFMCELAVMVVRGRDGTTLAYPVVETVQQNHICHVVRVPAPVDAKLAAQAIDLAVAAIQAIDGVGIFGVELFALADGQVLINELAPRPHNSGHYTIEACVTSQFENHLRAVLGWPLGPTTLRTPAAVMVNLLGQRNGPINPSAIVAALAVPGAHVHFYGKREERIGRKMGHVTALGATLAEAEAIARRAASLVAMSEQMS